MINRSLAEPEAVGPIYDVMRRPLLRFLGRRAGAKVAEGPLAARADGPMHGLTWERWVWPLHDTRTGH